VRVSYAICVECGVCVYSALVCRHGPVKPTEHLERQSQVCVHICVCVYALPF